MNSPAPARRDLLLSGALLATAPLLALLLAWRILREPGTTLLAIGEILVFSEALSLTLAYAIYRAVGRLGLASIHLKLALGYALGFGITALNIILVSLPMFIEPRDVSLLIVLLVFAGLVTVAFGYMLSRSITRAVERLMKAAEEMADGNLAARAQVDSADEIERLARAFNRMGAGLEELSARQRQLERARRDVVAAVSHDLRTPLASLRAMIEAINDGVVTDEATVERYLSSAQLQVISLSKLADDLFELAQLDAGDLPWQVEPGSLRDLISDTLESMHAQAEENHVKLSGRVEPAVDPVLMNSHQIQRVLYNLIQNGIRHTPADGAVFVEARERAGGADVQVDVVDTGEGIAERDLPYVFDQFYRGEKSRSRETGGAGLGLTIARRIVEAHQGVIWVESRHGAGSRFSFTLPKARL